MVFEGNQLLSDKIYIKSGFEPFTVFPLYIFQYEDTFYSRATIYVLHSYKHSTEYISKRGGVLFS